MLVDRLADDDGVIDDHTERDDEREERDHVDRHVARREEEQGPRERDWDAERHPECQACLEKEAQGQQDQDEADARVADQQVEPAFVHLGSVKPGCCVEAFRQGPLELLDVLLGGGGDGEGGLVTDTIHVEHDGAFAIVGCFLVDLSKAIPHGRHVTNTHLRAIWMAQKDDVAELIPAIAPFGCAQKDLARLRLHASAGQLHRRRAHACRDLIEGQPVFSELSLRDLDADLERANPRELDIGDARVLQQSAAAVFRHCSQRRFVDVSVEN